MTEREGVRTGPRSSGQPERRPLGPDASMGDMFGHLAQESRRFVELQMELVKMQLLQGLAGGLYDAVKIAAAAALLGMAAFFLVVAFALGVSAWLGSYWQGLLVTGLLLLMAGGVMLWIAVGTSFLLNVIPKDLLKQVRTLSRGRPE